MTVSFIIVSYKSSAHLKQLLPVLVEVDGAEIIVIENASSDPGLEQIVEYYPTVKWIKNSENIGFAAAVNVAAPYASSEYLCFLNPDISATAEDMSKLVERAGTFLQQGSVYAPAIPSTKGNRATLSAGYEPTVCNLFFHLFPFFGRKQTKRFQRRLSSTQGIQEVEWVSGACLLIAKARFFDIGLFSTRWFMYAEDIELCHRVRRNGGKVYHDSSITLEHEIGGSNPNRISTLWLENLYDYYCVALPNSFFSRFIWKLVVFFGFSMRSGISIFSHAFGRTDRKAAIEFWRYATCLLR